MEARLLTAQPQLFTTDLARAVAYYRERLGFTVVFLHGEPPFYGQIVRDGARLNLRHVDAMPFVDGIRAREHLLSAYVPVRAIDALLAEFLAAGAQFHQALTTQPWGLRDFVIRDPDGNLVCFSEEG